MQYWQHFTPMTVGQILDRTFTLYRNNFLRFVTIVAVVYVPIALLSVITIHVFGSSLTGGSAFPTRPGGTPEIDPAALLAQTVVWLIGVFLFVMAQALCTAALVKGVSESYLGGEVSVGEAYKAALPRLLSVVVATILVSIVCFLGFIACIAPGVIFAIWFALTSQSIVIERLGPVAGMSRSKQLVSGNLGKVFGTTFIAGLIASLASGLFQVIGALLTGGIGPSTTVTAATIRELFSLAGQALGMPISASVAILLYYDLRIRKEGFDLQMLAQTLGTQGMPADGQPPVQY